MKLTILSFTVVAFACIGQTPAEASKSGLRASTEISPYSGSVSVCELADEFSEECLGPIVTEDIEVTEEEESPEEENDAGRNLGIMTGKVCSMIDLNLSKRFDRHSSSWQSYQLPLPVTSNDHYKFYVMSTGFSATFCMTSCEVFDLIPTRGLLSFFWLLRHFATTNLLRLWLNHA
eukprot:CAMPEP_0178624946 /NCGR_PEP_ID=MMETSP0698-20121128/7618_1 /TAXON_ID=265572 /ORGANISM="Extubocellulus spinifer, Strain CCMP396" /LENGTH=175 /DNA_ID=CAMNT_0020264081 /DNA_START=44 /DNA_END=571 /DNA_ORIENTATION=-